MDIKKFGFYFLLGIILLLSIKLYSTIEEFFPAIFTGFVLAHLTRPIYEYFRNLTHRRTISAFIVLFIILLVVLIPTILVALALQGQIQGLLDAGTVNGVIRALDNLSETVATRLEMPLMGDYISSFLTTLVTGAQQAITTFGPRLLMNVTRFLLSSFIALFLLYYLLKNSARVTAVFRDYFPLSYRNSDILIREVSRQTRTLILGQMLIALIQGAVGTLGFLIFGVPGFLFWGIIMALVSFLPMLGASLVWLPAALILLAKGNYVAGVGILTWGLLLVSTIDNLVRPKLTSSLGEIHPVTVLLGVFIGLKEWGIIGLVIGPLIISIILILIRMFREEYLEE